MRKYIRQTYCNRFAGTGWVYADGTLSIKAHIWLMHAGSCSESVGDEPAISVPCKPMYDPLDCALLHYVRRPQAQAYIHRIEKTHRVTCDDGTPLAELGAT